MHDVRFARVVGFALFICSSLFSVPAFAQIEDQRSCEGLRDAVRKECRFLLGFWDPVSVSHSAGSRDDGHACDAAAFRRCGNHLRQLNQVCHR